MINKVNFGVDGTFEESFNGENSLFEIFLYDLIRLNYYFVPDRLSVSEDVEKFKVKLEIIADDDNETQVNSLISAFGKDVTVENEEGLVSVGFNLYKVASYNDIMDITGEQSVLSNAYLMYLDYMEQKANEGIILYVKENL